VRPAAQMTSSKRPGGDVADALDLGRGAEMHNGTVFQIRWLATLYNYARLWACHPDLLQI